MAYRYPKSDINELTSAFSRFCAALRWMAALMMASESLRSTTWLGGTSASCCATDAFRDLAKARRLSSFSIRSSRAAT